MFVILAFTLCLDLFGIWQIFRLSGRESSVYSISYSEFVGLCGVFQFVIERGILGNDEYDSVCLLNLRREIVNFH